QMMAADLMAPMASKATVASPAAGDAAIVQVAPQVTGKFSTAEVTSASGTTTQFTGTTAALNNNAVLSGGVIEQAPSAALQASIQLINGSILIHGTSANDIVSVALEGNYYYVNVN